MADRAPKSPRKPDYRIKVKSKLDDGVQLARAGVGWMNEDGSISI